MNVLIVYAHPEPTSFNAALAERAVATLGQAGLEYMGYSVEEPFVAYGTPRVGDEVRRGYLDCFAQVVLAAAR